jgi:hypothetical protein
MTALPDRPGDPEGFLDALLGYIQAVDASFVAAVEGASASEIRQYEAASQAFGPGRPMPGLHGAFLRRMGKRHGTLFEDVQLIVGIDELLDIYLDFAETDPDAITPRLPVVGGYVIGDQIALDLDTEPEDPEVVATSGGEVYDWVSLSWAHLLTQVTVLHVERRRRAEGRWYSSSVESAAQALGAAGPPQAETLRRIDALAAQLGLGLAWPSDRRHRIALGNDAALIASLGRRGEALLQVFADGPAIFQHVGAMVPDALGMRGRVFR